MPVFRYQCQCGYSHDQFLKTDKSSIVLPCLRCGRGITAHQVRDQSITYAKKNDIVGVLRNEQG